MIGISWSNILKQINEAILEYQITLGDCVKFAREYKEGKFHAILCDPPYHLTSIVKRFGKEDSAPAKEGVFKRSAKGFMGKQWDGGDVAFDPETWKAFKHILYPGAFGMAFASSRGWHRLAIAIEDAGFIIHPSLFGWVYGSGFPKATRIDTQIDQSAGNERGRLEPQNRKQSSSAISQSGFGKDGFQQIDNNPIDPLAKTWQGYRYGLQALKPALEPIIVFQKPYQGKAIENITKTGAGALNIEGGRIVTDSIPSNRWTDNAHPFGDGAGNEYDTVNNNGRWPANFYLDSKLAERLDKQSGYSQGVYSAPKARQRNNGLGLGTDDTRFGTSNAPDNYGDEGGASRFFFQVSQNIDESDPVYYCAKAGNDERNAGLDKNNIHPTLKPIDLNQYLATLLLPPSEYSPRRLFIPFSGVASEMIGGMLAGWDFIQGVELTEEYIPIAQARMEYWKNKPRNLEMFTQSEIKKMEEKPSYKNLKLFDEE